jgi:tRNA-specific 2-thiouridylase
MRTVFVGLSGGVDSAVSAALLKQQGYDVVGAFIKIWRPEFTECTWREDRLDAMRVCAALRIPYREIDLSDEYKREVIDSMLAAYENGITPNPDVLCNRQIKFGAFKKWALESGADRIATGHYARITQRDGAYRLHRGADVEKDQSYFLHRLTQSDLATTLFPVGHLQKSGVRRLANKFDLPVARKHDSQGLCFVGAISLPDFLSHYIETRPGHVVDTTGDTIGEHDGAAFYTIGQRHGFRTTTGKVYFVTAIDTAHNIVRVSEHRADTERTDTTVIDMHWIGERPILPVDVTVQARYRETPVAARLVSSSNSLRVTFDMPHTVALGQSLVVYQDDVCLGGGTIAR